MFTWQVAASNKLTKDAFIEVTQAMSVYVRHIKKQQKCIEHPKRRTII